MPEIVEHFDKISVIGLGYTGLPTAAIFADQGIQVIGVDVDAGIVGVVNSGRAHFGEPNLDALIRRVVSNGKLRAVTQIEPADAFIIAVPTPIIRDHGEIHPDTSFVNRVANALAPHLAAGNLVILESTVPVGTTERVAAILAGLRPDLSFPQQSGEMAQVNIAHCPERVLPGQILQEVIHNARVIGGMTRRCAQRAVALYKTCVRGECRVTDTRTAELAKLAENAYRDVNIAFANELSLICDKLQINVWELIAMSNLHPRVNILNPGPGVGGHCIAVDPWFIFSTCPDEARLIRQARLVNDSIPEAVCAKVRAKASQLDRPIMACLGLSYKRDVSDLRESPAVAIVETLARENMGQILVVEPHIKELPEELRQLGLGLSDFDTAISAAHIVVLLVDHAAFRRLNLSRLHGKSLIDTRGLWSYGPAAVD